jgi:ATP-dependent helicase/nuclease subunit A
VGWTKEQDKVIKTKNKDILVSAAAGSGKTAVLVERIINKVLSDNDPIDIDKILVLTFTKEAAREMRDRIRKAIDKASRDNPGDMRISRQRTLVHYAQISTIDSFCTYIVKNNFQAIGVDPDFRVVNPAESALMKQDAMDEVMEKYYGEGDEVFRDLISSYKSSNSDQNIRDMVSGFYEKSESFAWPDKWLKSIGALYDVETFSDVDKELWMEKYTYYNRMIINDIVSRIDRTCAYLKDDRHCPAFSDHIKQDGDILRDVVSVTGTEEFFRAVKEASTKFPKLSKKDADKDTEVLIQKILRDPWKKEVKAIGDSVPDDLTEIVTEMKSAKPFIDMLISLTRDYRAAYEKIKEDSNVLDFSDLEHDALRILVDEETLKPTEAALEFQKYFSEVMVDEYQDSNEVQEVLLSSVSGDSIGKHNYFCVGDVKQSIYGFRQADPGIFMKKFDDFSVEDQDHVRIDLNKNFRSRKQVLDISNETFSYIMERDMGDIDYTDEVSLKYGADFLDKDNHIYDPEIYYVDPSKEELEVSECDNAFEYECRFIARRIRKLIDDKFPVQDKRIDSDTKQEIKYLRPVRFSDIAVLTRSATDNTGRMTILLKALQDYNVDAVLAERSGYFQSLEVETIFSYLEILDNPDKDTYLVSVLKSEIGSLSNDELMEIRRNDEGSDFYNACRNYVKENQADDRKEDSESGTSPVGTKKSTVKKLEAFLALFDELRIRQGDMLLPDVISEIYDRTGFLNYVSSLPGGAVRRANLMKLLDEAENMENNSTHDLYSFMDYIRKRKKYNEEIDMASLLGEEDNVVRIMTIHKSKGLEFPVVFLIRAGGMLGGGSQNEKQIFSPKYGMAIKGVSGKKYKVTFNSFYLDAIKFLNLIEEKGEEQRILYVAMTRAKEKLIITGKYSGGTKDYSLEDKLELLSEVGLTLYEKIYTSSYFAWILPAVYGVRDTNNSAKYEIKRATIEKLISDEADIQDEKELEKIRLNSLLKKASEEDFLNIRKQIEYNYVLGLEHKFKNKYSVSEIKHLEIEKNRAIKEELSIEDSEPILSDEKLFPIAEDSPESVKSVNPGALRGTAMHRVLEGIDFKRTYNEEELQNTINEMNKSGFLSDEETKIISKRTLLDFLKSDTAAALGRAQTENRLMREQNFVFSEELKKIFEGLKEFPEDFKVEALIQGTIDALIVDPDGITVIDYKTDAVMDDNELAGRYTRQLQLYGEAASRALDLPVKALILYSFKLKKEVRVPSL